MGKLLTTFPFFYCTEYFFVYNENMNINLKATNFELTPAIREYAEKKVKGAGEIYPPDG